MHRDAPRKDTHMPPTERSPAELTLARHLARAVDDLLTVVPSELFLTDTIGVLLCRRRAS